MSVRRKRSGRIRIGQVSVYEHHGAWWVYYRDGVKPIRKRAAANADDAQKIGAQINAQLAINAPTFLSFTPISISQLRQEFLDHHECVLRSALSTVRRYRAATEHLERFGGEILAHELRADRFTAHLRVVQIAANGHANASRRTLRDKGVQFILETCRSMFAFAMKRRRLPPYAENPFADCGLDRLKIKDAKPIFVFDSSSEQDFLKACDPWAFPIHFTLAKTGLRVGELTHLLVEDLDLAGGWLHVRSKTELGWRVKTGVNRRIPLIGELVWVLRRLLHSRDRGVVFLHRRFADIPPPLELELRFLVREHELRCAGEGESLSRTCVSKVALTVWRDAGAIEPDHVRQSFIRVAKSIGLNGATCPKSWRHTFATLLQDANVDPLIRQQTLGHRGSTGPSLGMTAAYTHTRPETHRQQIEAALRQWPESLCMAEGGAL